MTRRNNSKTQEILYAVEEYDKAVEAIYITPPTLHENSDIDSVEEDCSGLVDNLIVQQLQTQVQTMCLNGERLSSNNDNQVSHDSAETECSAVRPPKRFKFDQIMRFIHVADNLTINNEDKTAKLRPLIHHLNKKYAEAYPMDQELCGLG
ncbi:unnamed protein product [Lepeophtheirus salmonis]|uniref:(salmon louse) hypothetical protein n=1 Tax=Lepeophtheirus salmonis TaxID=72036 RepID=A0A7R8CNV1_LEPSM|nr:unnamed protein product [Lepeophtheirus salmonis]CAF2878966.1 unnamed protein product [Lepeophtheirus salmonis]